jgi:hypothetical protein
MLTRPFLTSTILSSLSQVSNLTHTIQQCGIETRKHRKGHQHCSQQRNSKRPGSLHFVAQGTTPLSEATRGNEKQNEQVSQTDCRTCQGVILSLKPLFYAATLRKECTANCGVCSERSCQNLEEKSRVSSVARYTNTSTHLE